MTHCASTVNASLEAAPLRMRLPRPVPSGGSVSPRVVTIASGVDYAGSQGPIQARTARETQYLEN